MSVTALVAVAEQAGLPQPVDPRLLELKQMVLDSVVSANLKRNYEQALDALFLFAAAQPRTSDGVAGDDGEAGSLDHQRPALDGAQDGRGGAAQWNARGGGCGEPQRHPKHPAAGNSPGQLVDERAGRELLAVPDRKTLKGKRDYAILALLVGCGLRSRELASLDVGDIQMREDRWVIIDLCGKGGRIRTVAVPLWVKQGINVWMTAAASTKAGSSGR